MANDFPFLLSLSHAPAPHTQSAIFHFPSDPYLILNTILRNLREISSKNILRETKVSMA